MINNSRKLIIFIMIFIITTVTVIGIHAEGNITQIYGLSETIDMIEVSYDDELMPLASSTCNVTNNDYMMFTMTQIAAERGWSVGAMDSKKQAYIKHGGVTIGQYHHLTAGFFGPHFHIWADPVNIHYTLSGY